jgi:hypothetical protein
VLARAGRTHPGVAQIRALLVAGSRTHGKLR